MSESVTYMVAGIHCGHCAAAIEAEVAAVEGVTSVAVDLESKRVTVHGSNLSDEALREAIDEAGYEAA